MNKQDYYKKKYKQINKKWEDSLIIYKNLIDTHVNKNTKLLDIGCGHGDFLKSIHDKTKFSYGIDPDKRAIEKNNFIKHKFVGFADNMPFEDNFFDVAVLTWVLEHIENPEASFKEIYRVLKPGGVVIFLTPNVYNYVVWLIRLIPDFLHDPLNRKLFNRQENDTYPKYYRINSKRAINNYLTKIGFKEDKFILNGDPTYISFNDILFKISVFIEKILNLSFLKFAKVHIIGVYKK